MIYQIGDFYIDWDSRSYLIENDEFMNKFKVEDIKSINNVIKYVPIVKNIEELSKGKMLKYSSSSELYETDNGFLIIYHWATCRYAIAYYINDLDKDEVNIYINPKNDTRYPIPANWLFSIAGLHHILLHRKSPVLHASFIEWENSAILFTAPSQTGKSTQSKLWNKYENANIINDDRVLLRKIDNIWNAYGYPSCGSSKICVNKTLPLRTIVVLEQGENNKIVELSNSEKIRALVTGIEVFLWNIDEINMSIECANELVKDVKIFKLICKPNSDAVLLLKNYLKGEHDE